MSILEPALVWKWSTMLRWMNWLMDLSDDGKGAPLDWVHPACAMDRRLDRSSQEVESHAWSTCVGPVDIAGIGNG